MWQANKNGTRPINRLAAVKNLAALTITLSGLCPAALAQIPCGYEVTAIIQAPPCGSDGPPPTVGVAISPSGQYVCGYYYSCGHTTFRSFVYDTMTNVFTTLPMPAGIGTSEAKDVNDSGLVVGYNGGSIGDFGYIFDMKTGRYTHQLPSIDPLGTCSINAINAAGMVCGTRNITASPNLLTAFIWSETAGFTDLGLINGKNTAANDINDYGATCVSVGYGALTTAYLWQNGTVTNLGSLANLSSVPLALNNQTEIVGGSQVPLNQPPWSASNGFLWTLANGMIDLGVLPDHNTSVAEGINNFSLVVGCSQSGPPRAFVWQNGTMVNLDQRVSHEFIQHVDDAVAINDSGVIVANGYAHIDPYELKVMVLLPTAGLDGDVDHNCHVDIDDLLMLINQWGNKQSPADINGDGIVDALDLMILIENWTVF